MPARILDGKAVALRIRDQVAADVADLQVQTGGRVPGLAVVLVGDDPASRVYVRNKEKAVEAAGMAGQIVRLDADSSEETILATVDALNGNPKVHGILVQLPLPRRVDEQRILERIDPRKDVDGFHPENAGLLAIGRPRFVPCTPLGVQELLLDAGISTEGRHVVVIGRSQIVGKSLALLLLRKGPGGDATVTVCHARTPDVAAMTLQADIVVAAVGRPEAITGAMIRPGAVVVDVGINRRADGSLCGDVHYQSAAEVAGWITPVPGGVGPMTVAMLLRNTVHAFRLAEGLPRHA